jgi:hypothetical protein
MLYDLAVNSQHDVITPCKKKEPTDHDRNGRCLPEPPSSPIVMSLQSAAAMAIKPSDYVWSAPCVPPSTLASLCFPNAGGGNIRTNRLQDGGGQQATGGAGGWSLSRGRVLAGVHRARGVRWRQRWCRSSPTGTPWPNQRNIWFADKKSRPRAGERRRGGRDQLHAFKLWGLVEGELCVFVAKFLDHWIAKFMDTPRSTLHGDGGSFL